MFGTRRIRGIEGRESASEWHRSTASGEGGRISAPGLRSPPRRTSVISHDVRSPTWYAYRWSGAKFGWRPRQDSNLRSRLRRAVLYPLSYGGQPLASRGLAMGRKAMYQRAGAYQLTVVLAIIFVVLFSTRAGRSVERVRRAGD
jgi:hypothetical protein